MRVLVFCTGRSGSTTFARACQHMTNFSANHETAAGQAGTTRHDFPDQHIEVDNHLVWFLGEISQRFPDESTLLVHLRREPTAIAESYLERWNRVARDVSVRAFAYGLLQRSRRWPDSERQAVATYFTQTMIKNIEFFFSTRSNVMDIEIERIDEQFPGFWERIGAEGDLGAAMQEFSKRHNQRPRRGRVRSGIRSTIGRFL